MIPGASRRAPRSLVELVRRIGLGEIIEEHVEEREGREGGIVRTGDAWWQEANGRAVWRSPNNSLTPYHRGVPPVEYVDRRARSDAKNGPSLG